MEKIKLEELIENRATIKQIAKTLSCSQTNVRYWLKKFGLKTKRGPGGKLPKDMLTPRKCVHCGETDPEKFYGHKHTICGKCHLKYTHDLGREKRKKALDFLGGKCTICGFNKYHCSLEIHHLDPNKKDVGFTNYRYWKWSRIENELAGCVLLCSNCHSALHYGLVEL